MNLRTRAGKAFMITRRGGFTMHSPRTLAAAALVCAALATPSHAQTTLTYSSWVPPTHHLTIWQANWAAEVEKATGGRVKFQSLPKAPAAPPGTFDAVRDGLVDLSYVTASYTPARHILPLMAELPGMADTSEVNSVAYSRIHWKHFQKVGEYKGVKLLAVWTHGPGQMFTKRPINGINDVKGLKIRTGGGMYSSAFGFFMNEDKWNKLAKEDQAIIEKHSFEYAARSNGQSWDAADQKGIEALKKANAKIARADPAFTAEVKKRSAPIIDDWIKKASAKGVNAKQALDEFHAEVKKISAERR